LEKDIIKEKSFLSGVGKMNEEKDREKLRKQIQEFDDGFPDGVFLAPHRGKYNKEIKLRALLDYCKEHNLNVETIGDDIIEKFTVEFKRGENK